LRPDYFWYFLIYAFAGYLLETLFNFARTGELQSRKCRLFLPICPVYGFGVAVFLLLPDAWKSSYTGIFLCGFFATTAVEYCAAVYYEKIGVQFWDYSDVPGHIKGRVCLPFSLVWGGLCILLYNNINPHISDIVSRIPPESALPAAVIFIADTCISMYLLMAYGRDSIKLNHFFSRAGAVINRPRKKHRQIL